MKQTHALLTVFSAILFAICTLLPFASKATTTAVLLPNKDGNYKQMKPSSGSVHYTMVNESLCNGTTNYNSVTTTNSGNRDSYGISVTSVGMGDGALISQIDIVPCESRNSITTSTPVGSATTSLFYRWNGIDSSDFGTTSTASSITPVQLATSTVSGLSLFKTSTSIIEIGATYATGTKGLRLSRIATRLTYSLTIPTAPSSLAANNISTTENDLTWTDNSNNELGFKIYRSQNNAAFKQVATTTTWNVQSYNDTSATSGNTYSYKVSAYNSAGEATSSIVYSTKIISSDITSATTWQSIYVYVINGTVHVNSGATLTINAGTVVKFQTTASQLVVNGSGALSANGASTSTIYFTSYADDSVGGDSNGDATATTPGTSGVGDWRYVYLDTGASATFTHAIVSYAGNTTGGVPPTEVFNHGGWLNISGSEVATGTTYGVYQDSGTTTITGSNLHHMRNSTNYGAYSVGGSMSISTSAIHDNTYGAFASDGSLTLTSNTFTNNTSGAARFVGSAVFTHSGNTATGGINGFVMQTMNAPASTWTAGDLPYVIPNASGLVSGGTLTINAGAVVKFASGAVLSVDVNSGLITQGTSTSSVYFTSIKDDTVDGLHTYNDASSTPASSDWNNVYIWNDSASQATFNYTVIRYGGGGAYASNIYNAGGILNLASSEVATGTTYGIYQVTGTSTITSANVHNHTHGLFLAGGIMSVAGSNIHDNYNGIYLSAGTMSISGTSMHDNSHYGLAAAGGYLTLAADNTYYNNSTKDTNIDPPVQGGQYVPSVITTDTTLTPTSVLPYLIPSGGVTVTSGTTLIIQPGTIVKFAAASSKIVVNGTLKAEGTSGSQIYFTSIKDDAVDGKDSGNDGATSGSAGDWDTIQLNSGASSTISYAVVRFGGNAAGASLANLYNNGGTLTLDTVESATGWVFGIYQLSGTGAILSSDLHNNNDEYGAKVSGGTLTISATKIHDQDRGIYTDGGTLNVSASDIYNNSYGIRVAGGSVTITENAIHGNTSAGVSNVSGSPITADGNWWGSPMSPGACDPESPGSCSDATSSNITVSTWHHNDNWWLVNNNLGLVWSSTTTLSNDLSAATFNWNSATSGVGLIPITTTVSVTSADLVIYDTVSSGNTITLGRTFGPPVKLTQYFTDLITQTVQQHNNVGDEGWLWQRWVPIHELGHALGLGHYYGDDAKLNEIMYYNDFGVIAFGAGDKSDYNFFWNTLRWDFP